MMVSRPRPWLEHYDYWVPRHTNYPRRPLYEILRRSAAEGHDLTALSFLGADLTFGTLKNHADRLATALALRGIVKGDRVGVMLPNCPQYVIGVFAVLRLGAIVVNINPAYTAPEVEHLVRDSGIRMLITLERLAGLATPLRSVTNLETIVITSLRRMSYFDGRQLSRVVPPRLLRRRSSSCPSSHRTRAWLHHRRPPSLPSTRAV